MEKGVLQRDSLKPLLFMIVMDQTAKTCNNRTEKSLVGIRNLHPVYCQTGIYGDDVVSVAGSKRKMQLAVTEWVKTLNEKGMRLQTR